MILTKNNYYDTATDWQYLSPTLFKSMLACPAKQIAEMNGDWVPEKDDPTYKNEPLIMGNYVHSFFESQEAHDAYIEEHYDDIFDKRKKKPTMKADFRNIGDAMISTLADDSEFQELYQGGKEQIVTGTLFGHSWKGKIDCLNLENGYFIDLKTTADMHKRFWCVDHWGSFVENYNYALQMWVYQQLIQQTFGVTCQPFIVAVTKNKIPDKQVVQIEDYHLQDAELQIEANNESVVQMLNGEIKPKHCGVCAYCRKNKKLGSVIPSDELVS